MGFWDMFAVGLLWIGLGVLPGVLSVTFPLVEACNF